MAGDASTMVRVGIVSAIDNPTKTARVYYPHLSNMVSGWLPVLKSAQMPKVDEKVLVVYEPGFNSRGYVLGVIA